MIYICRAFAVNIGIAFKSPEEFFLGEQPRKWIWRGFDPSTLADAAPAFAAGNLLHIRAFTDTRVRTHSFTDEQPRKWIMHHRE